MVDLPRFISGDQGYSNANVKATLPGIQSSIDPDDTQTITIEFYDQVYLSIGNLSIYQLKCFTSDHSCSCMFINERW